MNRALSHLLIALIAFVAGAASAYSGNSTATAPIWQQVTQHFVNAHVEAQAYEAYLYP
jgi:hypothetical protein